MKIDLAINTASLRHALAVLKPLIDRRSHLAIWRSVRITVRRGEADVWIAAVGADAWARMRLVAHAAHALDDGLHLIIEYAELVEAVRGAGEVVRLTGTVADGRVLVETGEARQSIVLVTGTYPDVHTEPPTGRVRRQVTTDAAPLHDALDTVAYAQSDDYAHRSYLSCVLVEHAVAGAEAGRVALVATDGHRLAVVDRHCDASASDRETRGVIPPSVALAVASAARGATSDAKAMIAFHFAEGVLAAGDDDLPETLHVTVGDYFEIRAILREFGRFPDWSRAVSSLGDAKSETTINRRNFLSAVRRAPKKYAGVEKVVVRGKAVEKKVRGALALRLRVQLTAPEILALSSREPGLVDTEPDTFAAQVTLRTHYGSALDVAVSPQYLVDALDALDTVEVVVSGCGAHGPLQLLPRADAPALRNLHVIMPMRAGY